MSTLASGEHHTLALTHGGDVYSCGRPTYGRLGRADADVASDEPSHEPKRVEGFGEPVASIAAGLAVSGAITKSGLMFVWGYGTTGQLGKGDDDDEALPLRLKPTRSFPASGGIAVSLGGQHAAWLAAPAHDVDEGVRPDKARRTEA